MPHGPGKYDPECLKAMAETGAHTCVLIVIGGNKGEGFAINSTRPDAEKFLPKMLRSMADQIEGIN